MRNLHPSGCQNVAWVPERGYALGRRTCWLEAPSIRPNSPMPGISATKHRNPRALPLPFGTTRVFGRRGNESFLLRRLPETSGYQIDSGSTLTDALWPMWGASIGSTDDTHLGLNPSDYRVTTWKDRFGASRIRSRGQEHGTKGHRSHHCRICQTLRAPDSGGGSREDRACPACNHPRLVLCRPDGWVQGS